MEIKIIQSKLLFKKNVKLGRKIIAKIFDTHLYLSTKNENRFLVECLGVEKYFLSEEDAISFINKIILSPIYNN